MLSNRLHTATVVSHKPAGRGYHRLLLKAPAAAVQAQPGQFVMLRVSDKLDPLLARPFGIASVPTKTTIEILYRVMGRGTSLLTHVEGGQKLQLLGPLGKGFTMPQKNKIALFVAGGSGFPPLQFMAQRANATVHLFVGARTKELLPPASVLKNFKENTTKVHIATDDGSMGKKGMITDLLNAFLAKQGDKSNLVMYACGPHAMLAAVSNIAVEHSILCYVSMEERMGCGLGACMGCSIPMKAGGYKRACKEGPVFDSWEIEWGTQIALPGPHKK